MIEHLLALALHCHGGEFYRVALHKCVPKTSALARPFEHRPRPKAKTDKECCYVDAIIKVSPEEAVPPAKVEELHKDHIWIETDGSDHLSFEQTSKLWRWLVGTLPGR